MQKMQSFAANSLAPSWWANSLQDFVSLLAANYQLTLLDDTHIEVVAGPNDQAAVIAVQGLWRWVEATVTRAHPGGAAGAYDVFATAAANVISPDLRTDTTNYAHALAIVPAGQTPVLVAGTVDVYRRVGQVQWDGARITRVDQFVPTIALHAHRHATGGPDPIAPADIGAATAADLTAEVSRAEAAEAAEQAARIAGEANDPTAAQKAALAGTSGAPADANRYVTNADARNSDQRVPADGSVTDAKVAAGAAIAEGKLVLATDAVAGTGSRRTLGSGAQQAAAGNDARFADPWQAGVLDNDGVITGLNMSPAGAVTFTVTNNGRGVAWMRNAAGLLVRVPIPAGAQAPALDAGSSLPANGSAQGYAIELDTAGVVHLAARGPQEIGETADAAMPATDMVAPVPGRFRLMTYAIANYNGQYTLSSVRNDRRSWAGGLEWTHFTTANMGVPNGGNNQVPGAIQRVEIGTGATQVEVITQGWVGASGGPYWNTIINVDNPSMTSPVPSPGYGYANLTGMPASFHHYQVFRLTVGQAGDGFITPGTHLIGWGQSIGGAGVGATIYNNAMKIREIRESAGNGAS